jgi:predicted 2-oxoglutarate/Fe(II)-dependent dioxygenase YbiX
VERRHAEVILATVKEELGLPNAAGLTADLHSLLVYEPNQHFLAHQDSEKNDSMIGTLVVTLPSSYTGGELMVGHNEEWKAYRGSKTALSLFAFYADCRHEVLKVQSGYPDHAHVQPAPARRHQPSAGR